MYNGPLDTLQWAVFLSRCCRLWRASAHRLFPPRGSIVIILAKCVGFWYNNVGFAPARRFYFLPRQPRGKYIPLRKILRKPVRKNYEEV